MFKNLFLVVLILIIACLIAWPEDICEATLEFKEWSKGTYKTVSTKFGYNQDIVSSRGHRGHR